jgi:hypothetical protein
MTGIGVRSLMAVLVFAIAAVALWQVGVVRAEYWVQLSPWVPFLAGGFAVLSGTLVFRFWRLGERSEYYLRWGERLPFAAELALGAARGKGLVVGHARQIEVRELPRAVTRSLWIGASSCIALVAITNRGIALLHEMPADSARRDPDICPAPDERRADPAAAVPPQHKPGCKLVQRAFALGYAKSLGSCAPDQPAALEEIEVCTKRQYDEPYLHYAWRLLEKQVAPSAGGDDRGFGEKFREQLDHLPALFDAAADSVAMAPRSSHHLFVNLPDPHPTLRDRAELSLDHGACGAKLARAPRFPKMAADALGPSRLVEHVVGQLMFNPAYRPVVAECKELVIHWDAPDDACERIATAPTDALAELGVLDEVREILALRDRKAELAQLGVHQAPGELPVAQRIASFQCLIVGGTGGGLTVREASLDGVPFAVRETRAPVLAADGASHIRLYKLLAEVFAENFGYGRLTSNQAIEARPAEANLAATFRDPAFLLAKAELLRDADLFLGNEWLGERPDLLEIYPYHLHLQNFVEIFRRQYWQHRGRL